MKKLSQFSKEAKLAKIASWQKEFNNHRGIEDVFWLCNITDEKKFLFESNVDEICKLHNSIIHGTVEYWFYQMLLNERLADSLKTHDKMMLKLIASIKGVHKIHIQNDFIALVYYKEDEIDNDAFESMLNFGNYFIQKPYNGEYVVIEARKPEKVKYTNKYAYHVTLKCYLDKILKNGLIPRDRTINAYHGSRTYMWLFNNDKPNKNQLLDMESYGRSKQRLEKHEHGSDTDIDVVILRIDLEKYKDVRNVPELVVYGDPAFNLNSAVFTFENIPPSCIEIYKE